MKTIKNIGSWLFAICVSFILANILCFIYERPVAWIDREDGVTKGVRRPFSTIIHGTEGYGVTKLDKNGFANENKKLIDKDYILVMGSSHSQGKEVAYDEKYSYILNQYISKGDNNNLYVYNVASDANFLPSLLQRFPAGIEEFPNSRIVIMEIGDTDYDTEELKESLNQKHFNKRSSTNELFKNVSNVTTIKNYIKDYFPLISLYKSNLKTSKSNNDVDSNKERYKYDNEEYDKVINELLKKIRGEYDGKIIFVYHPNISINRDGRLFIEKAETFDTFVNAAHQNNIDVIDLSDVFLDHYNELFEVPYGFWNSQMGTGHLNKVGHKIMADEIYRYIKEMNY